MLLFDVNILLYAHRPASSEHRAIAQWFTAETATGRPFGMAETVLASFVRIATNPKVFKPPTPIGESLDVCDVIRRASTCVTIRPGHGHWAIFDRLCRATNASSKLSPDAYLAALAIEHGCEWVTADGDFARFPGLTWRHPLRGPTVTNPG